ncbi:MarR family transcriptional regulator [Deinococcus murrayi]|uniref:MarR family transcriptional regulator n=1 Tax=Deinococcus murrayi TaxID=68910 RepID=UPI0004884E7A|nr:MarR family transcriptional regulator [Deinococcus murrayi]
MTLSDSPAPLDLAAIRARHTLLLLGRLWQGDRARVDLARELGLSRSAISSIVTELMEAGLVD